MQTLRREWDLYVEREWVITMSMNEMKSTELVLRKMQRLIDFQTVGFHVMKTQVSLTLDR